MIIKVFSNLNVSDSNDVQTLSIIHSTASFLYSVNERLQSDGIVPCVCTVNFLDEDMTVLALSSDGIDDYAMFTLYDAPEADLQRFFRSARNTQNSALRTYISRISVQNEVTEVDLYYDESVKWNPKQKTYIAPLDGICILPYSKDCLQELVDSTREIVRYEVELMRDGDVREMFETCFHSDARNEEQLDMMVKNVVMKDVSILLSGLGHQFGTGDAEDLGVVLLGMMMVDVNRKVDFSHGWHFWMDNLMVASLQVYSQASRMFSVPVPNGCYFYLQALLSNLDDERYMNRYLLLMFNFASIIAKVDGDITEKESQYLAGLKIEIGREGRK